MVEGERFNEFLDSPADIALVSPAFDALEIRRDPREELEDLVDAGLVFGGDFRGERLVDCAHALEREDAGY